MPKRTFCCMRRVAGLCMIAWSIQAGGGAESLYKNDFESAKQAEVPDEFLVLNGDFKVQSEDGNSYLEVPGAPLEAFGVMFGPSEQEGVAVSARIHGVARGRRMPTFAVGLNGVAGYRLRVSPAKRSIELYKSDEVVASVPYRWKEDRWLWLRLEVRKGAGSDWMILGKVWLDGSPEPAVETISWKEVEEPFAGRPSVWGSPFSGKPIRFDDFQVTRLEG